MTPRFLPAGDRGILVELGQSIDAAVNARVRALDEALRKSPFVGYEEAIPAYASLLVFYEPETIALAQVRDHLLRLVGSLDATPLPLVPPKRVPTVYDGDDLDEVAREAGVTREQLVRLHSEREYLVYMVGFIPGFAYMGMTDPKLDLPRKATPRTRVPAGSVAIAMGQTGIYPADAPGGWHLLGRTEHRDLFDPEGSPPSFFAPGDRVRFSPVDALPPRESRAEAASAQRRTAVVEVEDGGLLTTVQDLGRPGSQRHGVPVGGAMDPSALREANGLVGNEPGAAALECTVAGPRLRCVRSTVVSLAGGDLGAVVERSDMGRWRPSVGTSFRLRPRNVLSFDGRRTGARAYIGFEGGIDVPLVLGSRSTYLMTGFGGYEGRALVAGDRLAVLATSGADRSGRYIPLTLPSPPLGERDIGSTNFVGTTYLRILWGPQDDHFTANARTTLESSVYTVGAASDRMGYRLEGPKLEHRDRDAQQILSDGNALGSIQVPPNGLPIVMLPDRATTGGYPKIATVVAADIAVLAQRLPGETVRFRAVAL